MSIINEALKKAKRERESVAYTLQPGDVRKSLDLEYSRRKFEINWGPLFVILVLVLITGPIVLPVFSTPFKKGNFAAGPSPISSKEMIPSENQMREVMTFPSAQMLATKKAQFSLEETPLFSQAAAPITSKPALRLSGIVYVPGKNSYCLINDKVATAGETVEGAKLISIEADKVTLEYQGEKIVLVLSR
jgi:hypothetical protein